MAGLILCRSKYADKPYYISNMGIHIRSLEELCYYIYHNIYLIGSDLVDEGLISYIERELEEPELARELVFLTSQNAGFAELMVTILRSADFYSDEEIEELRETIDELDTQNASERLKSRADSFLTNKRYKSAIRNYEMIVYGKKDRSLSMDFYGNVWHNMGVAYAQMLCYREAEHCFATAFEMNGNEASKQAGIAAGYLSGEQGEPEDDDAYAMSREIEAMIEQARDDEKFRPVAEAMKYRTQGQLPQYHAAMGLLIENWKTDYKNFMK